MLRIAVSTSRIAVNTSRIVVSMPRIVVNTYRIVVSMPRIVVSTHRIVVSTHRIAVHAPEKQYTVRMSLKETSSLFVRNINYHINFFWRSSFIIRL